MDLRFKDELLSQIADSFPLSELYWGVDFADDAPTRSNGSHKTDQLKTHRNREFLSGRRAATRALEKLAPAMAASLIEVLPNGAPGWPEEMTGSITHQNGVALAVVTRTKDMAFVGIDLQKILTSERALKVFERVTQKEEQNLAAEFLDTGGSFATWVFSAKEACFKALSPLNLEPPCTGISSIRMDSVQYLKSFQGRFVFDAKPGPLKLKVFSAHVLGEYILTLAVPNSIEL